MEEELEDAPLIARYLQHYPQVEIDFVLADRDICMLYTPASRVTPKVRTFVDFAVETLRPEAARSQN